MPWLLNCYTTWATVYPKKYAHGFVVLCFVVVTQSFIMNSHEVFIHIHQGYFAGTGAIVRLPQCQWSKPDGYGKISQCITTTKHSKAKTVCIFLGIYCKSSLEFNSCTKICLAWMPAKWLWSEVDRNRKEDIMDLSTTWPGKGMCIVTWFYKLFKIDNAKHSNIYYFPLDKNDIDKI